MLTEDFIRHVLAHPLQYSDGCAALAREVLRLRALSEPVWGDEQSEAIQSVESGGPMPKDKIDVLLDALDVLYQYASDEGCPNATNHRFHRPNRARDVVREWLKGMSTQLSEKAPDGR